MIDYVDTYYPDQKLLGKLSSIWVIRNFNLAQMSFNDQYSFLYMLTARKNLDQRLTTPNDSLIKFNQKIANKYKAGLGLSYLAAYSSTEEIDKSIKEFYNTYKLKPVTPKDFENIVENNVEKDVSWFFKYLCKY